MLHTRKWSFEDDCIVVKDSLGNGARAKFYLHFHPNVSASTIKRIINTYNASYNIQDYQYSLGFNNYIIAKRVVVFFDKLLEVKINFSG